MAAGDGINRFDGLEGSIKEIDIGDLIVLRREHFIGEKIKSVSGYVVGGSQKKIQLSNEVTQKIIDHLEDVSAPKWIRNLYKKIVCKPKTYQLKDFDDYEILERL